MIRDVYLNRLQRWNLLTDEERILVCELAREQRCSLWQVFDELYPHA